METCIHLNFMYEGKLSSYFKKYVSKIALEVKVRDFGMSGKSPKSFRGFTRNGPQVTFTFLAQLPCANFATRAQGGRHRVFFQLVSKLSPCEVI